MRALDVVVPDDEQLTGEIEGPRHTRLRQLLMTSLHQRLVAGSEPFVRELSRSLLDSMIERGHADLVADYAVPIPSQVLAHIIGLPREDFVRFRAWSEEVVSGDYATQNKSERGDGLQGAHPEFCGYIDDLADDRLANPRRPHQPHGARRSRRHTIQQHTDPQLDRAPHHGGQRDDDESHRQRAVRVAHHAGAAFTRASRPFTRARAGGGIVAARSPVLIQPRTTVTDVELRDVPIPCGARVVFSIAGANRDGAVFEAPDEFRVDWANTKDHLSFGAGPHFCPGAPLARLEARVAVEEFLDRVEHAEIDPTYEYRRSRCSGPMAPTRCRSA